MSDWYCYVWKKGSPIYIRTDLNEKGARECMTLLWQLGASAMCKVPEEKKPWYKKLKMFNRGKANE